MNNLLEILFNEPEKKKHIREIARLCKLSPNTVLSELKKLKKEGIIKTERSANLLLAGVNFDSEKYRTKKMIFNLESVYDSGLVDYLAKFYENSKAIILFGSYRRGEDISTSDIDIAIITLDKKRPDAALYEKKLKRSINLHLISLKEISEEFFNNLINGIVLKGYLQNARF
jgi:predicted nucleotidyltransferase